MCLRGYEGGVAFVNISVESHAVFNRGSRECFGDFNSAQFNDLTLTESNQNVKHLAEFIK